MLFQITNTIGGYQSTETVTAKRAEETLRLFANLIERGGTFPAEQLTVAAIIEKDEVRVPVFRHGRFEGYK